MKKKLKKEENEIKNEKLVCIYVNNFVRIRFILYIFEYL